MSRRARFHRLARRDLFEAAEYYERESPGLGGAFLDSVDACTAEILEHPEAGSVLHREIRRRLVPRFPFAVLYAVDPRFHSRACCDALQASTNVLDRS